MTIIMWQDEILGVAGTAKPMCKTIKTCSISQWDLEILAHHDCTNLW